MTFSCALNFRLTIIQFNYSKCRKQRMYFNSKKAIIKWCNINGNTKTELNKIKEILFCNSFAQYTPPCWRRRPARIGTSLLIAKDMRIECDGVCLLHDGDYSLGDASAFQAQSFARTISIIGDFSGAWSPAASLNGSGTWWAGTLKISIS